LEKRPLNESRACVFQNHEEKEPFGPGCRDYFWLICHLIDGITKEDVELSWEQVRCSNF